MRFNIVFSRILNKLRAFWAQSLGTYNFCNVEKRSIVLDCFSIRIFHSNKRIFKYAYIPNRLY